MWFQQDGATTHTTKSTMDQLRELFPQKLIFRNGITSHGLRGSATTILDPNGLFSVGVSLK
nr:unnamed protein product [Callosobruchus chinensis]